jgi:hypothetical protein
MPFSINTYISLDTKKSPDHLEGKLDSRFFLNLQITGSHILGDCDIDTHRHGNLKFH